MSGEKAKQKQDKPQQAIIPIDQVLQSQFAKVGQLQWELDTMRQMMTALENENKGLKEQLKGKKK